MPTAKKQPSGMYRCRVYSHTDAQGKQHYRSFTAPTKTEAESLANKFGNESFCREEIKNAQRLLNAIAQARKSNLTEIILLFEKGN